MQMLWSRLLDNSSYNSVRFVIKWQKLRLICMLCYVLFSQSVCMCVKIEQKLCRVVSLQHFVSNCGDYAVHMVDNLLDILTDCEHSKTNAVLLQV